MDELRSEELASRPEAFVDRNSLEGNSEMGSRSFQILYQNSFFRNRPPESSVQYCCRFHSQHKNYIKGNKQNSYLSFSVLFNPGIECMNVEMTR